MSTTCYITETNEYGVGFITIDIPQSQIDSKVLNDISVEASSITTMPDACLCEFVYDGESVDDRIKAVERILQEAGFVRREV